MKSVKSIHPEAFRLLGDETRKKIVFLLRVKEMTVSQLAAELNVTPQAVYHHIKKLLKAEMVEVAREERVDHLIESYYRATAEAFISTVGPACCSVKVGKEQMVNVLNALKRLGFQVEFDESRISELVDVQAELDECCGSGKFENAVLELEDVDFLTKQIVVDYAETLSMSNEDFARQQETRKKFRDLLKSLVKN